MGCQSAKQETNKTNNHIPLPQLTVDSGCNYPLNSQYYIITKGNKASYTRQVIAIPQEGTLIINGPKFYCFILSDNESPDKNRDVFRKQLHDRFYEKLSHVNWSERSQFLSENILLIFNEKVISSSTQSSKKPQQQLDRNRQQPDDHNGETIFSLITTQSHIFIYNPSIMNIFTVKDGKLGVQNQVKQRQFCCFQSAKLAKKQIASKVITWAKSQVDFLFFCSHYTSPKKFSPEETCNTFLNYLKNKFTVEREQIGWKYTLGQIKEVYKQGLREATKSINAKLVSKSQNEEFVQIGVFAVGGF